MNLWDSHHHRHDARLARFSEEIETAVRVHQISGGVVNATRESDWADAIVFAAHHDGTTVALGLHPWFLAERSAAWEIKLRQLLATDPTISLGEVGLDRWIEGHDISLQSEILRAHLRLACEFDRPITIHCVRAWSELCAVLKATPLPTRGLLIHAYQGPPALTPYFIECGAYFSFSPYFLHSRKHAVANAFATFPEDRILLETDAPSLAPPREHRLYELPDDLNHPAHLIVACRALASIRETSPDAIADLTAANHARLFGCRPH
jgi:TatD DNase family protein